MTQQEVVYFYNALEKQGIKIWVDGGFCVDALLEKELRPHKDLDIAIDWEDVPALRKYFDDDDYKQVAEDSKWNFVVEDSLGRQIDVHAFVKDGSGNIVDGVMYPKESLTGIGKLSGQSIRCISPTFMVEFLAPWICKWPEKYVEAVKLLCEKFNIPAPIQLDKYLKYGKYLWEILEFYSPVVLELPRLQKDPSYLQEKVKAVNAKGVTDVVTAADIYVQNKLKDTVKKSFPAWQFWGEEGEDNISSYDETKEYLFITDPIEGTNNFKNNRDEWWGSVVALVDIKTKTPLIGIVAHPSSRVFYLAAKDLGAFKLSYDDNNKPTIIDLAKDPLHKFYTFNNSPHFNGAISGKVDQFLKLELPNFEDPESGALEVATCRGSLFFKTSNEMAAVFVIMNELRGHITDFSGNPWSLGINTLISARTEQDYNFLKSIAEKIK